MPFTHRRQAGERQKLKQQLCLRGCSDDVVDSGGGSVGRVSRRRAEERRQWITAIGVQIETALVHVGASGSRVVSSLHQPVSARERKWSSGDGSTGFNIAEFIATTGGVHFKSSGAFNSFPAGEIR